MIKEGDLVQVVKPTPCCGSSHAVGFIAIVDKIITTNRLKCGHCNKPHGVIPHARLNDRYVMLSRLKRIPPLSELEQVKDEATV